MKMVAFLLGILFAILTKKAESIGVCYGSIANNLPSESDSVNLIKSNGNFNGVRIYDPDPKKLNALRGSNLQVILDVPNSDLQNLAQNQQAAYQWVQNNILNYNPSVSFKYIAVGNEVIPGPQAQYVLGAMSNIINALGGARLTDKIKVSTSVAFSVVENSYPPSAAVFRSDAVQYMQPIVKFLKDTGSPLLANVYPYFAHVGDPSHVPLQYALFTASGKQPDGQYGYQNLFDAQVDAVYVSLEKIGGGNVRIVVSESGWPSAGGAAATVGNAQTYNSNLLKHVGQGTPRRPGQIETFIFALFNENGKGPPETERNFGLYYPNKQPVYSI